MTNQNFLGPSAIINYLLYGIAKADINPQEFQICGTKVKPNREIRRKVRGQGNQTKTKKLA